MTISLPDFGPWGKGLVPCFSFCARASLIPDVVPEFRVIQSLIVLVVLIFRCPLGCHLDFFGLSDCMFELRFTVVLSGGLFFLFFLGCL